MNIMFLTELAISFGLSEISYPHFLDTLITVTNPPGLSPRQLGRTLKELAALKSQGDGTYEAQLQLRQLNVLLVVF